jgi:hypothetical protein
MMTDGRPATRRAMEERHEHLVLFDLALDYATTPRLGLARADQCGLAAFRTVCATLGKGGYACSPLDDVAGLVVMRLIAMLVNEAADAVAYGTAASRRSTWRCATASTIRAVRWNGPSRSACDCVRAHAGEPARALRRGALPHLGADHPQGLHRGILP